MDKFGRDIYPRVFAVMKQNERLLRAAGYVEAAKKPNLFYRSTESILYFADMRGTEEVPVWEDQRPLFYWRATRPAPHWQVRRIVKAEIKRLYELNCPCRLSFHLHSTTEFENTAIYLGEDQGIYSWDDGFCCICGEDFAGEGAFCSDFCRTQYEKSLKRKCKICGVEVCVWDEQDSPELLSEVCPVCSKPLCTHSAIEHHVTYFPEETVLVHRGCHLRIHRTDKYPELKPDQHDIDEFYGR